MNDDGMPDGWTLERVKEVGQLRDLPRLLDRRTKVTFDAPSGPTEIQPVTIIDVDGLVLVLDEARGEWLMGQQCADGSIVCWGSYGDDLGDAIRGL